MLTAVTQVLGARLRETDCLALVGGEEFVLLLRHCALERGVWLADGLRRGIAAHQTPTPRALIGVTVSTGIAEWRDDETFDQALHRADEAVYAAKPSGRDRVHCSQRRRQLA